MVFLRQCCAEFERFVSFAALLVALGGIAGMLLYPLGALVFGTGEKTFSEILLLGLKHGEQFAGIWSGGAAFIFCHAERHARRRSLSRKKTAYTHDMEKSQRYLVFGLGAAIGALAMLPVLGGLNERREQKNNFAETRELPGMFAQAVLAGVSIREDSQKFILEESTETPPEGFAHRRVFIAGGRRKFDKNGRPEKDSFLKITEDYTIAAPTRATPPARFIFEYADRVRAKKMPGADFEKIKSLALVAGAESVYPESNDNVLIFLKSRSLSATPAMLCVLREHPELVASAEAPVIDLKKEITP